LHILVDGHGYIYPFCQCRNQLLLGWPLLLTCSGRATDYPLTSLDEVEAFL
jgi:hypothetical protein